MLFSGKMRVRKSNELQCRPQIAFGARDKCDVAFFRRPAMRPRFAFGKNLLLVGFRQSNVAVTLAMDVHEHFPVDKKSVFVDAGVLFLGHAGEF